MLGVAVAPVPGAVKLTAAPGTRLPNASRTSTMSGAPNAVLTRALCGLPLITVIAAAAPAVLVSANDAEPPPDSARRVAVYVPVTVPAVAVVDARPEALLVAVTGLSEASRRLGERR